MTGPGAALLGSLLLAAPATSTDAQIQAGIARFQNLDDEGATTILKAALAHRLSHEQAAQVHLYLGLIAFNALQEDEARREFRSALAASPYVEMPTDVSPKAKLLLAQIRGEMLHESENGAPAAETAPSSPAPITATTAAQPGESRASRWWAWATAATAVAALGVGVGFGVAQSSAQAQLKTTQDAGQATSLGQSIARDGLIADVLFGVGGAAGVAALISFVLPGGGGPGASASLSLAPGALAARVRW